MLGLQKILEVLSPHLQTQLDRVFHETSIAGKKCRNFIGNIYFHVYNSLQLQGVYLPGFH
jgi:hypothetical protein